MSIPSPSHTGRNKNMNYSSSPDKFLQSLYKRKTKKKSHIRYHVVFSAERWHQWVFHFLQIFSAMSQTLLKGLTKHMLTFLAKRKYTIKKRERRSYLTHVRKCKFLLACRFLKYVQKSFFANVVTKPFVNIMTWKNIFKIICAGDMVCMFPAGLFFCTEWGRFINSLLYTNRLFWIAEITASLAVFYLVHRY